MTLVSPVNVPGERESVFSPEKRCHINLDWSDGCFLSLFFFKEIFLEPAAYVTLQTNSSSLLLIYTFQEIQILFFWLCPYGFFMSFFVFF